MVLHKLCAQHGHSAQNAPMWCGTAVVLPPCATGKTSKPLQILAAYAVVLHVWAGDLTALSVSGFWGPLKGNHGLLLAPSFHPLEPQTLTCVSSPTWKAEAGWSVEPLHARFIISASAQTTLEPSDRAATLSQRALRWVHRQLKSLAKSTAHAPEKFFWGDERPLEPLFQPAPPPPRGAPRAGSLFSRFVMHIP